MLAAGVITSPPPSHQVASSFRATTNPLFPRLTRVGDRGAANDDTLRCCPPVVYFQGLDPGRFVGTLSTNNRPATLPDHLVVSATIEAHPVL